METWPANSLRRSLATFTSNPMNTSSTLFTHRQPQPRILIVDDDLFVATLVGQELESLGYSSTCCVDPTEALSQLRDGTIDMLLTDYQMPEMTGVELAQQARKCNALIPIILMTGYGFTMQDGEMSLRYIDLILEKPFAMDRLEGAIKCTLSKKTNWY